MTGGRQAHPLLLSLAGLDMRFRMKASNRAFLLIALLPIPKFIHKDRKTRGVLGDRLKHECLDFIVEPLKIAARIGVMMADPVGNLKYCFTPLAAYIVDTPESAMLAGVAGKTSSVTMAYYKQFGDPVQHEPRMASTTLAQLHAIEDAVHPWNLNYYIKEAAKFRLNGVHRPFWRDWPMAEPSNFLTPEPLHHWHRMFWDHDAKWCIQVLGDSEIDFRFSVLHPHTTFRHFKEGISKLKQVTGREQRDMQRYMIPIIAGGVPKRFLIALRALADFRYLAQAPQITEEICGRIDAVLAEFHEHKDAVISAGARKGRGNKVINNWYIPKLEFLQSVVSNIRNNGAAIQWSADATERAHITEIKNPASSGNNQDYESQICRYLDRAEKCRRFDLATAVREARVDFRSNDMGFGPDTDNSDDGDDNNPIECPEPPGDDPPQTVDTTHALLSTITPTTQLAGTTRVIGDYFTLGTMLQRGLYPRAPLPFRTFVGAGTAVHLSRDPSYSRMTVNETAEKFNLPDLHGALADYINHGPTGGIYAIGGRRTADHTTVLPSDTIEAWNKVQVQNRAYHAPHDIYPAQTINASPPSKAWPLGRADAVLLNMDSTSVWPQSGTKGMRTYLFS
jgi:hypothetical protein